MNLMLYKTISGFIDLEKKKPFENIVGEKEKMLVTSIFSFSHNVFYFTKDEVCHLILL